MRGAFGVLGWAPDVFWASTLTEYMLAIEGFNQANGGGERESAGPSDEELADLVAKYG